MKRIIFTLILLILAIDIIEAQKVAQAIWTKGNTTLTFIYDMKVYKEGDMFNGQIVTNVWNDQYGNYSTWSLYNCTFDCVYNKWTDDVKQSLTTAVFDKSFEDYSPITMIGWFGRCVNLERVIGMEYLNTVEVKDMKSMFDQCCSLKDLDVSHLDTRNVTTTWAMFRDCSGLISLDVSNFNTSNMTDMSAMFSGCSKLTLLDVSNFDTHNVFDMRLMFDGCKSLTSLDVSHFNTRNVLSFASMFSSCRNLTSLDVNNFDTSNAETMSSMFCGCSGLTSLNLSNFDTSNVIAMDAMFCDCSSLTSLDLSGFDTSNVIYMGCTFTNCNSLISLNLSSFNTTNVIDMGCLFKGCSSLTSLDLGNFDTSNVREISYGVNFGMFNGCSSLTTLDLSSFNTSNITAMYGMFSDCCSLTSLNLSNFDTSNVIAMDAMFRNCEKLTSLDLSSFDTGNVKGMDDMFKGCTGLTCLDLSHFNTRSVKYMTNTFLECNNLKYISFGDDFVIDCPTFRLFDSLNNPIIYVDKDAKTHVEETIRRIGYNFNIIASEDIEANSIDGVNYWTTYYNSVASMSIPDGVNAYTGNIMDGNQLVLTKIENRIVPKGNAVILRGSTDKIVLDVNTTPKSIFEDNLLSGVDVEYSTPSNCYILGEEDDVAGFSLYNGETLPAHSAFLQRKNIDTLFYPLYSDDIKASIKQIYQTTRLLQGSIYNMQGQRTQYLHQGLNIVNGQKLLVK